MFKHTSFPAISGAGNVENYCHKLPNKKPCLIMAIKRMKKKKTNHQHQNHNHHYKFIVVCKIQHNKNHLYAFLYNFL